MLDYNLSLLTLVTSLGLAISFAFHHKMWRYCLSGFVFLILVSFILILRLFELVNLESWIAVHFYIISVGCIATIIYTISYKYKNYKKKSCKWTT